MQAVNLCGSVRTSKLPPISSVRFLAIERPRPLPSEFLARSPLTKRSSSSSPLLISSASDSFSKTAFAIPSSRIKLIRTSDPSFAYLAILLRRLSRTRQSWDPSAVMTALSLPVSV